MRQYIVETYERLETYSRPKTIERLNLAQFCSSSEYVPVPKGVCLILATWNFPLTTAFRPLIRAIACGCPVVFKPTERNRTFSNLMHRLIPKYLDTNFVRVVTGGVEVARKLLQYKFGLCYYVGGATVGKKVASAAGSTLTPCILECGGINPALVDNSCNIPNYAKRLVHGAVLNNGQLCIRPQYIMCFKKEIQDNLVQCMKDHI